MQLPLPKQIHVFIAVPKTQTKLALAMTKIGRSECEDNAKNYTCQTMPGYHMLENQITDALEENSKGKGDKEAQRVSFYKAMPLGLPKTRSALLVLVVRGLSDSSAYILDAWSEVLIARDLVVMIGDTVRPSLGTAVMGVTPPETRIRDVVLRLRRLVRQFSYHFSREARRRSERQSPKTHSRRRM
jgi:hypothetical protein